jgi:hypothetical protein
MVLREILSLAESGLYNRTEYLSKYWRSTTPFEPAETMFSGLPRTARFFLETNREYWRDVFESTHDGSGGYILIDTTFDRLHSVHVACTIGNCIAKTRNLTPVYLIGDFDRERIAIARSYYPGKFISINRTSCQNKTIAASMIDSVYAYKDINNIDDLLGYGFDDFPIGDLVYSTAMSKTGEGTFSEVTKTHYKYLFSASLLHTHLNGILENMNVEAAILHHLGYIQCGLLARTVLDQGGDVYWPKSNPRILRKYESLETIRWESTRPNQQLFERVYTHGRQTAIDNANRVMDRRFGLNPEDDSISIDTCDSAADQIYTNSPLSRGNPTVLILPHIFTEFLRNYDLLFRDYLTWYRELLRFASEHTECNWLVKPHPERYRYTDTMKQDVFSEANGILSDCSEHTVQFLPEDISNKSLLGVTDVVLTMNGTGGIEYSCYGIPTVLASKSPYSGFGFTYEPDSREAYFNMLASIEDIPPLTDEQIARAKVSAYIHFEVIRNQWPKYPSANQSKWESAKTYLNRIRKSNIQKNIEHFVEGNYTHLYNPNALPGP